MTNGLGKRIISIDENGIPKFSNTLSEGKWVGEIALEKENGSKVCNLCRETVDVLTDDHVPPQCMGNTGKFHYVNYFNFMTKNKIDYFGIAQGGIKFKTTCAKCNNEILRPFDVEIGNFVRSILLQKQSGKKIFEVTCRPYLIIKGLIGHFLTASLANTPSQIEEDMSAYFWHNKPFKNDVSIYVLPYLDENLLSVLRDVMWAEVSNPENTALISSLKCHPIAFLLYQGARLINQESWNEFLYSDDEHSINFDLTKALDKWNPEAFVPPDSVKVFGQNGAHSILAFREKEEI